LRSRIIALVAIVGVASGVYLAFSGRTGGVRAQAQIQYRQEAVARGQLRATITGTGPIASVNGVMVRSNQSGTVTQVRLQDGDSVKAGDVVIVLDNENLAAQLKQAQIDLTTSLASLDALLNPLPTAVRGQALRIEQARLAVRQRLTELNGLQLNAPQGGVISSVKAIQGSSVTANSLLFTIFDDHTPIFVASVPQSATVGIKPGHLVSVEIAGFGVRSGTVQQNAAPATPAAGNRDSNVPLEIALPATPGIRAGMVGQANFTISGSDYPVLTYGFIQNNALEVRTPAAGTIGTVTRREGDRVNAGDLLVALTNEQLSLSYDQAVTDLEVAEYNLATLLDPHVDPNSQVRAIRNKIEASEITVATRRSDLQDLQVKAPVAGQISALAVRVGDRVTINQQLVRVADYGKMQVTIMVDELDVAKTKVGQEAAITLDALPGRPFAGKVTKVNPEGIFRNDIATFEVTVTVNQPEGLMAGMNATVNITVEDRVSLYLPAQAVTVRQGVATVQVLENEVPVQKEIHIGLRAGQRVEVLDGLALGDKVITTIIRPPSQTSITIPFLGGLRSQQPQGPTTPQVRP